MPSATWWACYAVWAAGTVGVALRINAAVSEPYMDEIFHVPQAQAYCDGDWAYWDGALTTPPGLYLFPALVAAVHRLLTRILPLASLLPLNPCSLPSLRAFNLLLSLALPFLYISIAHLLSPLPPPSSTKGQQAESKSPARRSLHWEALIIALFPLVNWWSWLFYTDLASLISVLLCWREGLKGKYCRSAFVGAASLWFRQTNIVWLAFVGGQAVISKSKQSASPAVHDPFLSSASSGALFRTPFSLVETVLRQPLSIIPVLAYYLPVFAAAGAFVKWNGGIVLGDKQNHVATLHVPQLYYFVGFAAAFFAPQILSVGSVKRAVRGLAGSISRVTASMVTLVGMCWTIKRFTIAHPFLLADNRHYAFYLWRRVINVHPFARYALAPGYLLAGRLLFDSLAQAGTMSFSTFLLFAGATTAVLVPTPLIEPRYFIIPLIILRLYLIPSSSSSPSGTSASARSQRRRALRLFLEAALYLAVQAVCVYLFLEKPFFWDVKIGEDGKGLEGRDEREVGRRQRFMW
ncbi:hypothetical protein JCM6882_000646 [Rhodosporidiobolus microsporus]